MTKSVFIPRGIRRSSISEKRQMERRSLARQVAELVLLQKTTREISEELGISVSQVRAIMKTDEYDTVWRELERELSFDPRRRAAIAEVHELLPLAMRALREALEGEDVPWTVRMQAIQSLIRLGHLDRGSDRSDPDDLVRFLAGQGIKIEQVVNQDNRIQILGAVPQEFMDLLRNRRLLVSSGPSLPPMPQVFSPPEDVSSPDRTDPEAGEAYMAPPPLGSEGEDGA